MKTLLRIKPNPWEWFVLIALAILLILILTSCIPETKLEKVNNHFIWHTEALIIVNRNQDSTKLLCKSPAGICWYEITDYRHYAPKNDTIDLRYNQNTWVYKNVRILKY